MTALKAFVAAAVLACAAAPAIPVMAQSGPSFNCARARTFVEKAICRSPALSAKDRRMSSEYYRLLNWLKNNGAYEDAADLKDAQRRWLYQRDRCQTTGCLQQAYDQRIAELKGAWD